MPWTTPNKLLLPLVFSGIFIGAFLGTIFSVTISTGVLALASIVAFVTICFLKHKRMYAFGIAVLLFSILLGIARAYTFNASIPNDLSMSGGSEVVLMGLVASEPEKREGAIRFRLNVETLDSRMRDGMVLVSTNPYEQVHYGDVVQVNGVLKKPESFVTDTGVTFHYEQYLRAHRTTHTISFAQVVVLEEKQGNSAISFLIIIKQSLVKNIEILFPDPEAPLLSGLLLGEKQSLGDELYEAFQKAGVVHMIVLSGYNVSLVANSVMKVSSAFLPRSPSFVVSIFSIVAFALMTGASETTIRASLMALVLLVGTYLNRPHEALRALLGAGALMLLFNPYLLVYDLSFQLSFLATLGIILWADSIALRLKFLPQAFGIRDIGGATLAAQIAVLPLLMYSIGAVSLIAPLSNILILGAVPYAMLFGFISSLLAFLHPLLAFPTVLITEFFLSYILTLSVWFGNLPLASFTVPREIAATLSVAAIFVIGGFFYAMRLKNVLK